MMPSLNIESLSNDVKSKVSSGTSWDYFGTSAVSAVALALLAIAVALKEIADAIREQRFI